MADSTKSQTDSSERPSESGISENNSTVLGWGSNVPVLQFTFILAATQQKHIDRNATQCKTTG
jgi:hypothetical protein